MKKKSYCSDIMSISEIITEKNRGEEPTIYSIDTLILKYEIRPTKAKMKENKATGRRWDFHSDMIAIEGFENKNISEIYNSGEISVN